MTTTMKEMLDALAALLGATTYNGYVEARKPVLVPIRQEPPRPPERY